MPQQKTEEQLTAEIIQNLEKIIQFINTSAEYKEQASFIKNLQSIVDKKNKPSSKGATVKARTLESLKIAVANTKDLKMSDGNPYSQQEKSALLDACMKQVTTHVADLPEDVIRYMGPDLTDAERIDAAHGSAFFKAVLTKKDLFLALFMGEEDLAEKIVRAHPDLLFEKGTYKMPLLNQDGTPSQESEQIYHDVTPLQLMLYTGDWKMQARIIPLIPEARLEETFQEMHNISHGGPDLVKIDRDPTTLTVQELQHYHVKDDDGKPMDYPDGQPVLDDSLHNRNGIFCCELDSQHLELYFVDIHPETGEKTVIKLADPANMTPADQEALNQFKTSIRNDIAMNSSLRTSDEQHQLIARLFRYPADFFDKSKAGQPITLHREGIHYELRGKHYHDTYDGCVRLKNAYRRYLEICQQDGIPNEVVGAAWRNVVGMAQRLSVVHVIQRFCEKDKPFYPLQNKNDLKYRKFIRTDKFANWITNTQNMYPLRVNSDVGFNFGLNKAEGGRFMIGVAFARDYAWWADVDLAAIRLIDEVRKACFNEQMLALGQKLHPSDPGCVVM